MGSCLNELANIGFTAWGIYLLITGEITNGLLALIIGELIVIDSHIRKN